MHTNQGTREIRLNDGSARNYREPLILLARFYAIGGDAKAEPCGSH
jgi:hypothetical protein